MIYYSVLTFSNQFDIMPFNVLQAYSQDAYLKGNEAYSGNAQHIPEPPPICYPRIEVKTVGTAQTSEPVVVAETPRGFAQGPGRRGGTAEKSYRVEISVPPSPPPEQTSKAQTVVCICNENVRAVAMSHDLVDRTTGRAQAEPSHRTEENRYSSSPADTSSVRPKPVIPTFPGDAQLQYPSTLSTESAVFSPPASSCPGPVYPDKLTQTVRTSLIHASPDKLSTNANRGSASPSTSQHKNIDWKNYTTYKDYIDAKRLHTYGCRTIQERLDSLRAAASSGSAYAQQHTPPSSRTSQRGALGCPVKPRSVSMDCGTDARRQGTARTLLRSASQEKLGGGRETSAPIRNWPRSSSEDALPFSSPTEVTKQRAKSCDYLGQSAVEPGADTFGESLELENRLLLRRGEEARASRQVQGLKPLPHLNRNLTGQEEERRGSRLSYSPLAAPVFTKGTTDSVLTLRKDGVILRPSRLPVKNSISDTSSSLSSVTTTDYFKYQRTNFMDSHVGYSSPLHLQLRCRADSLNLESRSEPGLAARSSSYSASTSKLSMQRHLPSVVSKSCSSSSHTNGDVTQKPKVSTTICTNGTLAEGVEGPDATVVVLRRDKNSGSPHVRPPSYVQAVSDNQRRDVHKSPPLIKAGSEDGAVCWMSNSYKDRHVKRLGDPRQKSGSVNLDDSLDSIPFIGKTEFVMNLNFSF